MCVCVCVCDSHCFDTITEVLISIDIHEREGGRRMGRERRRRLGVISMSGLCSCKM